MQLLQRAEKGTYVSTVGPKDFLDVGAAFYQSWGYPNVKRVSTMKDVLDDLDTATGTIDRFRIVTHALNFFLEIGLLPEIDPQLFTKESTEYTNEQRFRQEVAKFRLVNETSVERS